MWQAVSTEDPNAIREAITALCSRAAGCVLLRVQVRAERLPIKTYSTSDGLPSDHINRIVQDSKGFLWFGTNEGLSRFDGYKFTNYGIEQGLAAPCVNDFLETRSGAYWVATDEGLCRFIPDALAKDTASGTHKRFVVYYPAETEIDRAVYAICEDHNGTVWCGTDGGLYRLDQTGGGPVFSFVDIIQPLGVDRDRRRIVALIEDRHGSIWIIAQSGLYVLRPGGQVERYGSEEGLQAG
ncbi:MAG TPA: two-component regulator propeller domain-containing protein, partial [Blastocatellia bacterium]|nr:two-component regulator propeller domain-containing protein [Blastocatellia bacterium]